MLKKHIKILMYKNPQTAPSSYISQKSLEHFVIQSKIGSNLHTINWFQICLFQMISQGHDFMWDSLTFCQSVFFLRNLPWQLQMIKRLPCLAEHERIWWINSSYTSYVLIKSNHPFFPKFFEKEGSGLMEKSWHIIHNALIKPPFSTNHTVFAER